MQLKHYYIDVSEFVLTQCQIFKSKSLITPKTDITSQQTLNEYTIQTPNSFIKQNHINLTPNLTLYQNDDFSIDYFELQPLTQQHQYFIENTFENIEENQISSFFNIQSQIFIQGSSNQERNTIKNNDNQPSKVIPNQQQETNKIIMIKDDISLINGTIYAWWQEPKYLKVMRYLRKKQRRNWNNKFSYKCRRNVASVRLRIKGKFIGRSQAQKILNSNLQDMSNEEIKQKLNSFHHKIQFI